MSNELKRQAAAAALKAEIRPGMRIGLGTGSTAREFVALLGVEVAHGFDCLCVPTSEVTAVQAEALSIPLATLDEVGRLDLTIDGADEVGPQLALIKGGGGALLREKIVAAASDRMVVIADGSKIVPMLGRFPLPVEVGRFGLRTTVAAIEAVMQAHQSEGPSRVRLTPSGEPFVTDGGHLIVDAFFGRIPDPEAVATDLERIPGVVEHGLFLKLCRRAYIAGADGVDIIEA